MDDNQKTQIESLCPECGHAFKTYVDRVLQTEPPKSDDIEAECPVCGCSGCRVGK